MRFPRPSPAMVVALVALVFATTGSAVAAVTYARNAGAVDGVSAVRANSRASVAAGKVVATARGGADKGKIPARFIAGLDRLDTKIDGRGSVRTFSVRQPVQDNANGARAQVIDLPFIGQLAVSCNDANRTTGREDPRSVVTLVNASAAALDVVRMIGNNQPLVTGLGPNTELAAPIDGSTAVQFEANAGASSSVRITAGVRQDGVNTADGSCLVFGQASQVF